MKNRNLPVDSARELKAVYLIIAIIGIMLWVGGDLWFEIYPDLIYGIGFGLFLIGIIRFSQMQRYSPKTRRRLMIIFSILAILGLLMFILYEGLII